MMQVTPNRHGRRGVSLLVAAAALAVGGVSSSAIFVKAASAAPSHRAKSIVISTSKNAQIGTILVSGTTLYTLKANKTPCSAQCLRIWPAVLLPKGVTKARAGTGVNAAKLGTRKRGDALQVTYSGKALYRFSGDTIAGQVNGPTTTTWGTWSVFVTVKPAAITPAPASNTPASPTTSPTPTTTPAPATTSPPMTTPTPATTSPTTTTTPPTSGGAGF
jgi:predicted lipoprotein with Yx(FWY)xxD motif